MAITHIGSVLAADTGGADLSPAVPGSYQADDVALAIVCADANAADPKAVTLAIRPSH